MTFTVFSFCTYRTTSTPPFTEADWAALKFIKALKGKPVNGYAYVPVRGQQNREFLNASTAPQAADWFGRMVGKGLRWTTVGDVILVPVPHSACSLDANDVPRTLELAQAAAQHIGPQASVEDLLRWRVPMTPAHQGGTRDVEELYGSFVLAEGAEIPSGQIVLVDDVLTTGAHFRAAAAFLTSSGGTVSYALCAGRADNAFFGTDAFAIRQDHYTPYEP